jgi:hypothetical protein
LGDVGVERGVGDVLFGDVVLESFEFLGDAFAALAGLVEQPGGDLVVAAQLFDQVRAVPLEQVCDLGGVDDERLLAPLGRSLRSGWRPLIYMTLRS